MSIESRSAQLSAVYQELILDHYRRPRNRGMLERPSGASAVRNPLCGDEMELTLAMADGHVADIKFTGRGCSISQASASMMSEAVRDMTPEQIADLGRRFADMLRAPNAEADPSLGLLRSFSGVARLPALVRCALLAWNAIEAALKDAEERGGTDWGRTPSA